jgi:hypothetical protein
MLQGSYDMEERGTTGDLYWRAPTDGFGGVTTQTIGNDGSKTRSERAVSE